MRTIKLHHPTGHPYWNEKQFTIEMPNGEMFDLTPYHTVICSKWNQLGNDYMIEVKPDGIYYQQMTSSSGTGRIKVKSRPRDLIIPSSEYDSIEYVGEEMVISEHLRNDLKENGIC